MRKVGSREKNSRRDTYYKRISPYVLSSEAVVENDRTRTTQERNHASTNCQMPAQQDGVSGLNGSLGSSSLGWHFAARSAILWAMISWIAGPSPGQPFKVTGPYNVPANVVKNASVINLYMSNDWDHDSAPSAPAGETKEALDSWTQALIAGPYFTYAANDYGIGVPKFMGGFNNTFGCGIPSPGRQVSNWDVGSFVNCALTSTAFKNLNLTNPLANVFVDPRSMVLDPFNQTCIGNFSAYHGANQDLSTFLQPYTVIPANPVCLSDFKQMTSDISHEMIEALTDPAAPFGWVHRSGPLDLNIPHALKTGEVADICDPDDNGDRQVQNFQLPFAGGLLAVYWSNSLQACVPPPASSNPVISPALPTTSVLEDSNNVSLIISGSGFGAAPTLPQGLGTIPYFLLVDTSENFNAGSSIDGGGDTVQLRFPSWSDSTVEVQIPIQAAGSQGAVYSCDSLNFTIWNPATGASASGTYTLPGPTTAGIIDLTEIDSKVTGTVFLTNSFFGPFYTPTKMNLVVNQGNPREIVVGPQGYSIAFSAQATGPQTVQVNTAAPCSGAAGATATTATVTPTPIITKLTPDHGLANGSNNVTISGVGFTNVNAVQFGAQAARSFTVKSDTEIDAVTPAEAAGYVSVSVGANGTQNQWPPPCNTQTCPDLLQPSPAQYFFFVPGAPVLRNSQGCGTDWLTISGWYADGTPLANELLTITTSIPTFNPPSRLDSNGEAQVTLSTSQGGSVTVTFADGASSTTDIAATQCVPTSGFVNSHNSYSQFQACSTCGFQDAAVNYNQSQYCAVCGFQDGMLNPGTVAYYDVVSWGLMSGIGNQFLPNGAVTRAQLAASFARAAGPRAIAAAKRTFGVTNQSTLAAPEKTVTRAEAARFLNIVRQRPHGIKVSDPYRMFTRGDLARVLWTYLTRDLKLTPGSSPPKSLGPRGGKRDSAVGSNAH